jgi:hypothetical protein
MVKVTSKPMSIVDADVSWPVGTRETERDEVEGGRGREIGLET